MSPRRKGPAAPEDLVSAVQTGNQRTALIALRDNLARAIEIAKGDVVRTAFAKSAEEEKDADQRAAFALGQIAALSKQLRDTLAALAALKDPAEKSPVDEIAKRRADRRAGTEVRARPARKVVGGGRGGGSGGDGRADPRAAPAPRARGSARRTT